MAIPPVKLEKCPKQKFWIKRICLGKELFYYNYPFLLPDFFKQKMKKDEFEVRFKFIQVFSSVSIEKKIYPRIFRFLSIDYFKSTNY